MKADCIPGVLQNLFICGALGAATLEFRTKGIVTFIILLNYHGKSVSRHDLTSSNTCIYFIQI
jgi:hypothetical protein